MKLQALDLQLKWAPSKVFLKYFDHSFTWLLFRTHIFQNTYFLKAPPLAALLKRWCYDNIWTFEQNKVKKFRLSFLQFLNLLKKVIREKVQPPWKYHPLEPVSLPPKILIFPTSPIWQFSKITQPLPTFRWGGHYGFVTHELLYFVRDVFPNLNYSS